MWPACKKPCIPPSLCIHITVLTGVTTNKQITALKAENERSRAETAAAASANSIAKSLAAKHAEEIESLKSQFAAKEQDLLAKIADFEKQFEALNASLKQHIDQRTADAEEVWNPEEGGRGGRGWRGVN